VRTRGGRTQSEHEISILDFRIDDCELFDVDVDVDAHQTSGKMELSFSFLFSHTSRSCKTQAISELSADKILHREQALKGTTSTSYERNISMLSSLGIHANPGECSGCLTANQARNDLPL